MGDWGNVLNHLTYCLTGCTVKLYQIFIFLEICGCGILMKLMLQNNQRGRERGREREREGKREFAVGMLTIVCCRGANE